MDIHIAWQATYIALKPVAMMTTIPAMVKRINKVGQKIGTIVFRAKQSGIQICKSSSQKKSSLRSKIVFTVERDRNNQSETHKPCMVISY